MKNFIAAFVIIFCLHSFGQTSSAPLNKSAKPKIVIGLVVDQMRWDYLYRFQSKYGTGGFNKLTSQGYTCEFAHYNYVPTYTAPGHASIYTGSVPAIHGIIGNDWYDKNAKDEIYCVSDSNYYSVGTISEDGRKSPKNMLSTVIGDELKISNGNHSKVIGIAIKDRSSILPAGHAADGAYWLDSKTGQWITSTYYRNDIPAWLQKENEKIAQDKNNVTAWKTILALDAYTESTADNASWEYPYKSEKEPVFPHDVTAMLEKSPDVYKTLPYGNTMTLHAAKAVIEGEKLGSGKYTDMLCVSLSSTDMIQHQFGSNAVEVEDMYLRLDKDLSLFLTYLDVKFGRANYVLFLTADHGGANNASFLRSYKIPAGNTISKTFGQQVDSFIKLNYGEQKVIAAITNQQVYFDHAMLNNDEVKISELKSKLSAFIKSIPGVSDVVDLKTVTTSTMPERFKTLITNSYNPQRSGDLYIILEPAWMEDFVKGTTHGTQYAYDTHIPMIFFGGNIKAGKDYSEVNITDIAPTISALLKIQEPNGCIGKPVVGVLK